VFAFPLYFIKPRDAAFFPYPPSHRERAGPALSAVEVVRAIKNPCRLTPAGVGIVVTTFPTA
jgi:hypothetical protein